MDFLHKLLASLSAKHGRNSNILSRGASSIFPRLWSPFASTMTTLMSSLKGTIHGIFSYFLTFPSFSEFFGITLLLWLARKKHFSGHYYSPSIHSGWAHVTL